MWFEVQSEVLILLNIVNKVIYIFKTLCEIVHHSQLLLISTIGLLGLLVGSFLNVIIYRLPIIEKYELSQYVSESSLILSLCHPNSFCPNCKQSIKYRDNIPLLSYFLLKGKCRHCHHNISPIYPVIETLTALLSLLIALKFGFSITLFPALFLSWTLIVLSFIDINHYILPDSITLPALWVGLSISLLSIFQDSASCILGAVFGYSILWLIYWIFKWITHKEGLGFGDFKMFAMLGAWLGWQSLPMIILIASTLGILFGFTINILRFIRNISYFKNKNKLIYSNSNTIYFNTPYSNTIPFGPFLAIGGHIMLFWPWSPIMNIL